MINNNLLLLANVLKRLALIIYIAASMTLSLIMYSAASASSSTSIISMRHSFFASLSSTSFLGSEKSAILWHAFSLAKYRIYHFEQSTSTTNCQILFVKSKVDMFRHLPLNIYSFLKSILIRSASAEAGAKLCFDRSCVYFLTSVEAIYSV